ASRARSIPASPVRAVRTTKSYICRYSTAILRLVLMSSMIRMVDALHSDRVMALLLRRRCTNKRGGGQILLNQLLDLIVVKRLGQAIHLPGKGPILLREALQVQHRLLNACHIAEAGQLIQGFQLLLGRRDDRRALGILIA